MYIYMYICIHIYRKRESERERESCIHDVLLSCEQCHCVLTLGFEEKGDLSTAAERAGGHLNGFKQRSYRNGSIEG